MNILVRFRYFLPLFIFAIPAACTPLVGAMLDKPRDAAADGPGDTVQEVIPICADTYPCPEGYACLKDRCDAPTGLCRKKPETCEGEPGGPVCGCNSVDYGNECEMLMADQSKKYDGECISATCGWENRIGCGSGNYCEGFCGDESGGMCLPVPAECAGIPPEKQVCGCQESEIFHTYRNECERIVAGAWFAHQGSCEDVVGCMENDPEDLCGPEMYCEGDEGACGSGMPGWCEAPPFMCDLLFDPVCGCDDRDYASDCERQVAGVWRKHWGRCRGNETLCTIIVDIIPDIIDEGCPENMFCELPKGSCPANVVTPANPVEIWGVCVDPLNCEDPPLACDDGSTPVCGCDSVQFADDCERRRAGVQVACCGECEGCSNIPPVF